MAKQPTSKSLKLKTAKIHIDKKIIDLGNISIEMLNDGSGFIFHRGADGITITTPQLQRLIEEYNSYHKDLVANDQIHADMKKIIAYGN